jgi:hypothetical protein
VNGNFTASRSSLIGGENEEESHTRIRKEEGKLGFDIHAFYDKMESGHIYSIVYLLSLVESVRIKYKPELVMAK